MSGFIAAQTRLLRRPDVLRRIVGGEVLLIAPRTLGVHVLNGIGERVWELAEGHTLAEVTARIALEYVADTDRIADDVRAFAALLIAEGLLEARE